MNDQPDAKPEKFAAWWAALSDEEREGWTELALARTVLDWAKGQEARAQERIHDYAQRIEQLEADPKEQA